MPEVSVPANILGFRGGTIKVDGKIGANVVLKFLKNAFSKETKFCVKVKKLEQIVDCGEGSAANELLFSPAQMKPTVAGQIEHLVVVGKIDGTACAERLAGWLQQSDGHWRKLEIDFSKKGGLKAFIKLLSKVSNEYVKGGGIREFLFNDLVLTFSRKVGVIIPWQGQGRF